MKHDLVLFFGRFHPLLVHLPIGGLALAAFLELMAALTRRKQLEHSGRWIVDFVALSTAAAAAACWMRVRDGDYDTQLLTWHQALGITLIGTCLLTCFLRRLVWPWGYRVSLLITLGLVVLVGQLGGSITHGRAFFTTYALESARARLGHEATPDANKVMNMQQTVFDAVIAPIVEQRCSTCHGAERQKAQLRLDTPGGWLRGGQDGPVISPGDGEKSLVIQRLMLPLDADGHMPPEDQPQPTAEEIALLEWWINAGAPTAARVTDLDPKPEIMRLLRIVSARPAQHTSDGPHPSEH
jgi:uncharacterized membrane protein